MSCSFSYFNKIKCTLKICVLRVYVCMHVPMYFCVCVCECMCARVCVQMHAYACRGQTGFQIP